MEIKLIVDENVTSCAQLRAKRTDEERHFFECGIDMLDNGMFISNYPPVYGDSFAELVTRIMQWRRDVDKRNVCDIESLLICDDSEAIVPTPSYGYGEEDDEEEWKAYFERVEEKKKANKEELSKNERAFRGLTLNDESKCWEGVIKI